MVVEISLISDKVVPEGFLPAEVREIDGRCLVRLEAPTDRFQVVKVVLVRVEGEMRMLLFCDLKITQKTTIRIVVYEHIRIVVYKHIRIVPFGGQVEIAHERVSRNQIVEITSDIPFQGSNDLGIIRSSEWLEQNMNMLGHHGVTKKLKLLQFAGKPEVFDKQLGAIRRIEIGVTLVGYRGYEVLGPFDIEPFLGCTVMKSSEAHNNLPVRSVFGPRYDPAARTGFTFSMNSLGGR